MDSKPGMAQTALDFIMAYGWMLATGVTIWALIFNGGEIIDWLTLTIRGMIG